LWSFYILHIYTCPLSLFQGIFLLFTIFGLYYARKLANLQQNLFEALEKRHTGELDPFDVDEYIHRYHKQSQELYSYINAQTHSNARLPIWLPAIDADEQGIEVWEPATKLPPEHLEAITGKIFYGKILTQKDERYS
jgi:hypothetical protein